MAAYKNVELKVTLRDDFNWYATITVSDNSEVLYDSGPHKSENDALHDLNYKWEEIKNSNK